MPSIRTRMKSVLKTTPHRFQVEGVRFIEVNNGRAIVADDMGLGKTYQALAYAALHPEIRPILIECPATLKYQWQRELLIHAGLKSTVLHGFKPFGVTVQLWAKKRGRGLSKISNRWFNSESKREAFLSEHWHRIKLIQKRNKPMPRVDRKIAIVNYDVLEDWQAHFAAHRPKLVIVDECQNCINPKAKRTILTKGIVKYAPHALFLSGTPMVNRPVELFPILNMLLPKEYPSLWNYAFRYCAPKRGFRGRGWDFSGHSHTAELHRRLAPIMIRRMKTDVLKDLPPKVRSIIPVDISNRPEYERACDMFVEWLTRKKGVAAAKRAKGALGLVKMGELQQLIAEGKLPTVITWIKSWLDEHDSKLVVFATHRKIVDRLMDAFPTAVRITGQSTAKQRRIAVLDFQKRKDVRLLFGNIIAAGTGLDGLQKVSSTAAFIEMGWTPTRLDQCEDRVLRMGQLSATMNAYYFTGRDTIEEGVMAKIEEKREVGNQVLDGGEREVVETVVRELIRKKKHGASSGR